MLTGIPYENAEGS